MTFSPIRSVCVYCGALPGNNPAFRLAASDLGKQIATSGLRLVYGAGGNGLMGEIAKSVLNHRGHVTGVVPRFLTSLETVHQSLQELRVVETMHERKSLMFDLADAFITLPGGIGTLDETIEIITWRQLGRHNKPLVIIDIEHYWKPFLSLLDHVTECEFGHGDFSEMFAVAEDPVQALRLLTASS